MPDAVKAPSKLKMPFLSSLAGEIDKLVFETEEEAKQIVQRDLVEARGKKDEVMTLARARLSEHRGIVSDLNEKLNDAADALGSNSGERKGNGQTEGTDITQTNSGT